MDLAFPSAAAGRRSAGCALALACSLFGALAGPLAGEGRAASRASSPATEQPAAALTQQATLEQCVTSVIEAERSVTFSGEMTAVPGTARMAMRIDVQERTAGEPLFRTVVAPGLGVWRTADAKVKVYKYLKQVTNLSAPATYRALVRFRWMNVKGRVIKHEERFTPACEQPAAPPASAPDPAAIAQEAAASAL